MYFCNEVRDKTVGLICNKSVLEPKEYNLRRHYRILHRNKFGVLEVKVREVKLQNLESALLQQQNNIAVCYDIR
jgi:hypothetical protein